MKTMVSLMFASLLALLLVPAVNAQIAYTATDISGTTWQYNYTVTDSAPYGPKFNLTEFTVYFPSGLYSNLQTQSSPSTWSSVVTQPEPSLHPDGFFDALASNAGLASGKSQSGFSVRYTYSGQGFPASQLVDVRYVSPHFVIIAGGDHTVLEHAINAPELDPSSFFSVMTIVLSGLLMLMEGGGRQQSNAGGVVSIPETPFDNPSGGAEIAGV